MELIDFQYVLYGFIIDNEQSTILSIAELQRAFSFLLITPQR